MPEKITGHNGAAWVLSTAQCVAMFNPGVEDGCVGLWTVKVSSVVCCERPPAAAHRMLFYLVTLTTVGEDLLQHWA